MQEELSCFTKFQKGLERLMPHEVQNKEELKQNEYMGN
jgi:hypothetical protein